VRDMSERNEGTVFRVVNAHSGRALDEFLTERAAEERAVRELGRVGTGRFRIERRDAPGEAWQHVRDVGEQEAG
jgi:hypothetical protein